MIDDRCWACGTKLLGDELEQEPLEDMGRICTECADEYDDYRGYDDYD